MISIYVECDTCHHSIQVHNLKWFALVCPKCKGRISNEHYSETRENPHQEYRGL